MCLMMTEPEILSIIWRFPQWSNPTPRSRCQSGVEGVSWLDVRVKSSESNLHDGSNSLSVPALVGCLMSVTKTRFIGYRELPALAKVNFDRSKRFFCTVSTEHQTEKYFLARV